MAKRAQKQQGELKLQTLLSCLFLPPNHDSAQKKESVQKKRKMAGSQVR